MTINVYGYKRNQACFAITIMHLICKHQENITYRNENHLDKLKKDDDRVGMCRSTFLLIDNITCTNSRGSLLAYR